MAHASITFVNIGSIDSEIIKKIHQNLDFSRTKFSISGIMLTEIFMIFNLLANTTRRFADGSIKSLTGTIADELFLFPITYIGSCAHGAFIVHFLSFMEAVVTGFGGTQDEDVG